MDYKKLSEKVHQNAFSKGFWKTDSNQDEKFMLILTELGEAVEAHRKEKWARKKDFVSANAYPCAFVQAFEKYMKDTVEDELADVVIRCLDYLRRYRGEEWQIEEVKFEWAANFAENILKLIRDNMNYEVEYIISYVDSLAKEYNINLEYHISWKMKYNAQREKLHGKAY